MNSKITFPLVFILFLFSCGNHAHKVEIELNQGEKWKVNAEMMPAITASENRIAAFVSHDEKDFKALAGELKENNQLLISSCTMTGKSHDELHKWLHPHMALVEELANAGDEKESREIFQKIEQSFETFHMYFE